MTPTRCLLHISFACIVGILSLSKLINSDYNTPLNATKNSRVTIEMINPNSDDLGSLCRLPDIGAKTAQNIINYRDQCLTIQNRNLPFAEISDLSNVKGIGPKTISKIQQYITLTNIR